MRKWEVGWHKSVGREKKTSKGQSTSYHHRSSLPKPETASSPVLVHVVLHPGPLAIPGLVLGRERDEGEVRERHGGPLPGSGDQTASSASILPPDSTVPSSPSVGPCGSSLEAKSSHRAPVVIVKDLVGSCRSLTKPQSSSSVPKSHLQRFRCSISWRALV